MSYFSGLPEKSVTWMSHGDYAAKIPEGFEILIKIIKNISLCNYLNLIILNRTKPFIPDN